MYILAVSVTPILYTPQYTKVSQSHDKQTGLKQRKDENEQEPQNPPTSLFVHLDYRHYHHFVSAIDHEVPYLSLFPPTLLFPSYSSYLTNFTSPVSGFNTLFGHNYVLQGLFWMIYICFHQAPSSLVSQFHPLTYVTTEQHISLPYLVDHKNDFPIHMNKQTCQFNSTLEFLGKLRVMPIYS